MPAIGPGSSASNPERHKKKRPTTASLNGIERERLCEKPSSVRTRGAAAIERVSRLAQLE